MSTLTKALGMDDKELDMHMVVPIPARLMKNEKVAIITGNSVEDVEFFYPYYRLTEAGYTVDVITEDGESFEGKHGLGIKKTLNIGSVNPQDYALLYLPGGKAPAALRKNKTVIKFIQEFAASGKPIAAICHGPQLLVTAGLVKGKQIAAFPEVQKEIEEAGGTFVNEALVEDGQFITGRKPGDLHRHLYGVMQYLEGNVANQSRSQRKSTAA